MGKAKRIGISLGDITGVGPEVVLKALARPGGWPDASFLIIGDEGVLRETNRQLGTGIRWEPYNGDWSPGRVQLANPLPDPLPSDLLPGSPKAAQAAMAWLREGAERCLRQEMDALVTAPVSKEAIVRAGFAFIGQTEFLSELSGTDRTIMMLLGPDERGRWLRVALATTHVAIKHLAAQITRDKVLLAIELAAKACADLGLPRARVAVCGLNPHAGEGGQMGTEELTDIKPAVQQAQSQGLDVVGPMSADTLFHYAYRGDFDAVVAMYHDQGLAPLKMVAFDSGVNWTLGLPFARTSPDHGTAYNIAGQGIAEPTSTIAAITLAAQLVPARSSAG
jgi:4-hydroxythreonine-4-phosphate dehydrogenase